MYVSTKCTLRTNRNSLQEAVHICTGSSFVITLLVSKPLISKRCLDEALTLTSRQLEYQNSTILLDIPFLFLLSSMSCSIMVLMVDFPSFPLRNIVVSALSLTYQKVLVYYILVRVRIHPKLGTLIFRLSLRDSILICPSLQFEVYGSP